MRNMVERGEAIQELHLAVRRLKATGCPKDLEAAQALLLILRDTRKAR
jgi:hypothetical protein